MVHWTNKKSREKNAAQSKQSKYCVWNLNLSCQIDFIGELSSKPWLLILRLRLIILSLAAPSLQYAILKAHSSSRSIFT
jgi:hypothetical protein